MVTVQLTNLKVDYLAKNIYGIGVFQAHKGLSNSTEDSEWCVLAGVLTTDALLENMYFL